MSKTKIEAYLKGNMAFEMNLDGHTLIIDARVSGVSYGPLKTALTSWINRLYWH